MEDSSITAIVDTFSNPNVCSQVYVLYAVCFHVFLTTSACTFSVHFMMKEIVSGPEVINTFFMLNSADLPIKI